AKFGDALKELKRRGLLDIRVDDRGVWFVHPSSPTDRAVESPSSKQPPLPSIAQAGPQATNVHSTFRRLRNVVWLAFIADSPTGRRFMNKDTGDIRIGLSEHPEPTEKWAEIQQFDATEERADAHAFLKTEGLDGNNGLNYAIETPAWDRRFSSVLQRVDSQLALKWKRRRSHRVIVRAEQWRQLHGIAANLVYEGVPTSTPGIAKVVKDLKSNDKDRQIREIILSAAGRMSTDQLLKLNVPVSDILAAARPDLFGQ
ncbi:MAG TPA: hypothetical protein VFO86_11615, partial [Terriglobia bacterium]|nr:hypothetical protein [Terriglobia bacterium]